MSRHRSVNVRDDGDRKRDSNEKDDCRSSAARTIHLVANHHCHYPKIDDQQDPDLDRHPQIPGNFSLGVEINHFVVRHQQCSCDAVGERGFTRSADSGPEIGQKLIVPCEKDAAIATCIRQLDAVVGVGRQELAETRTMRLVEQLGTQVSCADCICLAGHQLAPCFVPV